MTKQMLIDATHDEETRVAIVEGYKLLEFDYESKFRKPLKGSIFLAKVTRVEPSLQAAFVNFGGNRHGFLPFSEIHPDYFRIPIADREALLAEQQAALEEMEKEDEIRRQESQSEAAGEFTRETAASSGGVPSGSDAAGETLEEIAEDVHIEEIGGTDSGLASSDHNESGNDDRFEAGLDEARDDVPDDAQSEPFGDEIAAQEGEPLDEVPSDSDTPSEHGDAQRGEEQRDFRHDRGDHRRGGRFRGRGRGRHGGGRGRHRMAHHSRRVESFGGEDYDDNGGGDRFRFNLRRKYKIQEVIKRGQIMLVQVSKEERGNKGAAVSTYLSLPGRYCVLMPNSPRAGGVSRKIASYKDRARMREIVQDMDVPKGMSVIVRTAGVTRSSEEIKRDLDYLMRLWDNIRELTLQSSAPAIVYEEADLIKRAVRDLYGKDIEDVIVSGEEGFETARNFMKMLMPSHTDRITHYTEEHMPLFNKFRVEEQIAEIGESQVTLPSGGYLVINQTEALVAIDVNSGRATKERHIEETALKTNMEAAHEVARQLRLRDLGGLVVVDFIDMEDRRNNARVERKMRDALSTDRARIQMGRISSFGLMELSRQRLNPSLTESQFEICNHCSGMGRVRTCDATSIMVLRALEEEGIKRNAAQLIAHVSNDVAVYILNNKRKNLSQIESRYGLGVSIRVDDEIAASKFRIETLRTAQAPDDTRARSDDPETVSSPEQPDDGQETHQGSSDRPQREHGRDDGRRRNRRGGRNRGRGRDRDNNRDNRDFRRHDESRGSATDFDVQPPPLNDAFQDLPEDPDDSRGNREYFNRSREAEREFERGGGGNRRGRDNHRRGGRNRGGRGPDNFRRGRNTFDGGGDFGRGGFDRSSVSEPQPQVFSEPELAPESFSRPAISEEKTTAKSEDRSSEHARTFEKLNEPPKEKKRGWWSKGS